MKMAVASPADRAGRERHRELHGRASSPTPADVDALHRPFDEILDVYVRDGLVYYFALKQERGKFDRYVQALGEVCADCRSRAGRPSVSWRTGSTPTTRLCCAP